MESNKSKQSRRSFIKKAAAGAAITSLPVKSVWATTSCSMSGQLSGNLSQTSGNVEPVCEVPILSGGRSPGFWYNGNQLSVSNPGKAVNDVFPQMGSNASETIQKCWVRMVLSVRDNNQLGINSTLANMIGVSTSITLTQAFMYSGTHKDVLRHGAAVYLNTYFELYNGVATSFSEAQSRMAAEEVANMVMNKLYLEGSWATDNNLGYNDGYSKASSSSFLFSNMSC